MKNNRVVSLCLCGLLLGANALAYNRTIDFSGYTWQVKTSSGRVGPGPNNFSDSLNNVWMDAAGLHMKITKNGGRWYCAEVICTSLGFGAYRFYLASAVDALDPNVVLGLFTWSDDPAYNDRELDIEFSRWGAVNNQNAQYVVQPYNTPGNLYRFQEPAGYPQTTHSFQWLSNSVAFLSLKGWFVTPPDQSYIINQHTFTTGIPPTGGAVAPRINLWLYQGRAPTNRQPVEVIINKFEYAP
ncbi:MAG: hypothetical protein HY238_05745 [Acidobacteria bacterium]|nr:hypothetical protein [Acidobacteriota bacterium]